MNQRLALFLCAAAFVGAGCDRATPTGAAAARLGGLAAATDAQLRIVHASATSGAFDLYLEGSATPFAANLAYGNTTGFVTVAATPARVLVRTAGAAADSAPLFTSDPLPLAAGTRLTTIAAGLLGTVVTDIAFRLVPLAGELPAADDGSARLRFFNASHGLASVGFDVDDDGTVEAAAIGRFGDSGAAGVSVPAKHHGHERQLALDSGNPATRLTGFTLARGEVREGARLLVIAAGLPTFTPRDARGLALIVVDDEDPSVRVLQNPALYFLHAIADADAIDAFVLREHELDRDPRVVSGLAYSALSTAVQVPPSKHGDLFLLAESGAGNPLGLGRPIEVARTGQLDAGERYLIVASGFEQRHGAATRVKVTVLRDGFTTDRDGQGRVRALHAVADAPALDVGRVPPGETAFQAIADFTGLVYRGASPEAGTSVSPTPLNPAVRPNGGGAETRFDFTAVTDTDRVFGVVAGAFAPASTAERPLGFIVVKAPNSGRWTATLLAPAPTL